MGAPQTPLRGRATKSPVCFHEKKCWGESEQGQAEAKKHCADNLQHSLAPLFTGLLADAKTLAIIREVLDLKRDREESAPSP